MAFKKYQSVENVSVVQKSDSEAIRKVVKEAGATSASQLTDAQRSQLPRS